MNDTSPGKAVVEDFLPFREALTVVFLLTSTLYNFGIGWIILRKTPKVMNDFRLYLLELLIACVFFQWISSIFFFPYILHTDGTFILTSLSFTAVVGVPLDQNIVMTLFGQGVLFASFSNIHCFYYRMYVLQEPQVQRWLFKCFHLWLWTFIGLAEMTEFLFILEGFVRSDTEIRMYSSNALYSINSHQPTFLVETHKIVPYSPLLLFVIGTTGMSAFVIVTYTHYCLYSKRTQMSAKTRLVHRQLFWALLMQFASTTCCGMCPIFFTAIVMVFNIPKMVPFLNLVYIVCLWSFGYTLATVIVLSNKPYRTFIIQKSKLINFVLDVILKTTAPVTGLVIVDVSTTNGKPGR